MAKRLVRISPWQTAKTLAVVYFAFGLIIGIPFGLLMSVMPEVPGQSRPALFVYLLFPFLYAVFALIFVPIGCWIYNVAAKFAGGIEVTVEPQTDA